jgi:hypothetical protein
MVIDVPFCRNIQSVNFLLACDIAEFQIWNNSQGFVLVLVAETAPFSS